MDADEIGRDSASKGALGLLVGLALVAAGVWMGRQLHIVWSIWPSTDGVVTSSSVVEILEVPSSKGSLLVHRYKPKVEFRYTAAGKQYTTQAESEYTADTYQGAARKLARLYSPGTHHPIRYNPRDPGEIRFGTITFASLVPSFVLLIAGIVLSVWGANSLLLAYSRRLGRAAVAERGIPAVVVPFEERSRVEPAAAILHCPACGRPVEANQDSCPNCLKSLRAA